jgi:ribosomal protein L40E
MSSVKCLKCGTLNSNEDNTCKGCGDKLLRGQEYEERFQELKDYEAFRKRYSILGIIVGSLVLLLLYPAVEWLFRIGLPMLGAEFLPAIILEYAAPAIVLLTFLIVVPPMILGRWKIWRRYRWTREKMQDFDLEVKSLPKDFFRTAIPGGVEAGAPARKLQGPPIILLVMVFALLGLVCVNEYTDFKPLDSVASLFGIGSAQTVEGEYTSHFEAVNLGGGVTQVEQTWSYVFHSKGTSNGTYTSYLNGYQQYSGTWSQSGNILTVNVPAIANATAAYSFQATVSRDGDSFTVGKTKWIKVKR